MREHIASEYAPLAISEDDVLEAMKLIKGYIDITPEDFREVYKAAHNLAIERLFNTVTASTIMTRPAIAVPQEMALAQAAALLAEKHISGAPVINQEGAVVGIVSEKDFLKEMGFVQAPSFMQIATHCLNDESCMIGRLQNKTVSDIMVKPPLTGSLDMRIGEISALFVERKINRLPIIDENRHPVGIVTRTDLAHSLYTIGSGLKS